MPSRALLIAVALWLAAVSPVMASAMTVQQFMAIADRIPHNPTAIFRPDTHRLIGEVKQAVLTVKAEQASAVQTGRQPVTCLLGNRHHSPDPAGAPRQPARIAPSGQHHPGRARLDGGTLPLPRLRRVRRR